MINKPTIRKGNVAYCNIHQVAFIVYDASKNNVRDFHGGWHERNDCDLLYKDRDYRPDNRYEFKP